MKIVSILENQNIEKRIAITPEIAKKYISLGFEVSLANETSKPRDIYFFAISGVIAILFSMFWFSKIETIFIH